MKKLLTCALLALWLLPAKAQDAPFLDTSDAEQPFQLGIRVGINSSNQTNGSDLLTSNVDSWGIGFEAGAVFDINIRDFFTLQPGIFFSIRNNKYCHSIISYDHEMAMLSTISNEGKTRHTTFTIPVLASFRFNLSDELRWQVDAGPYFEFGLGGYDKGNFLQMSNPQAGNNRYSMFNNAYYDIRRKFDWGLKVGTGLRFKEHYYAGVHYEAGFCRVYKSKEAGGHNKGWMFTLGYDF